MLTPLDIEQKEFSNSGFGYSKKDVDGFLDTVITDYESIYKENIDLKERIEALDRIVETYRNMEDSLKNTLLLAERTAEETKAAAHKEAENIKVEADHKATVIIDNARDEAKSILNNMSDLKAKYESSRLQIKQMLKSQLELLDNSNLEILNKTNEDE